MVKRLQQTAHFGEFAFRGDDYILFKEKLEFAEAQESCLLHGGNLARYNDAIEFIASNRVIEDLYLDIANTFWIGIESSDEGVFRFTDSSNEFEDFFTSTVSLEQLSPMVHPGCMT